MIMGLGFVFGATRHRIKVSRECIGLTRADPYIQWALWVKLMGYRQVNLKLTSVLCISYYMLYLGWERVTYDHLNYQKRKEFQYLIPSQREKQIRHRGGKPRFELKIRQS